MKNKIYLLKKGIIVLGLILGAVVLFDNNMCLDIYAQEDKALVVAGDALSVNNDINDSTEFVLSGVNTGVDNTITNDEEENLSEADVYPYDTYVNIPYHYTKLIKEDNTGDVSTYASCPWWHTVAADVNKVKGQEFMFDYIHQSESDFWYFAIRKCVNADCKHCGAYCRYAIDNKGGYLDEVRANHSEIFSGHNLEYYGDFVAFPLYQFTHEISVDDIANISYFLATENMSIEEFNALEMNSDVANSIPGIYKVTPCPYGYSLSKFGWEQHWISANFEKYSRYYSGEYKNMNIHWFSWANPLVIDVYIEPDTYDITLTLSDWAYYDSETGMLRYDSSNEDYYICNSFGYYFTEVKEIASFSSIITKKGYIWNVPVLTPMGLYISDEGEVCTDSFYPFAECEDKALICLADENAGKEGYAFDSNIILDGRNYDYPDYWLLRGAWNKVENIEPTKKLIYSYNTVNEFYNSRGYYFVWVDEYPANEDFIFSYYMLSDSDISDMTLQIRTGNSWCNKYDSTTTAFSNTKLFYSEKEFPYTDSYFDYGGIYVTIDHKFGDFKVAYSYENPEANCWNSVIMDTSMQENLSLGYMAFGVYAQNTEELNNEIEKILSGIEDEEEEPAGPKKDKKEITDDDDKENVGNESAVDINKFYVAKGQTMYVGDLFAEYKSQNPGKYRIKAVSKGGKATINKKNKLKAGKVGNVELVLQRCDVIKGKKKWTTLDEAGSFQLVVLQKNLEKARFDTSCIGVSIDMHMFVYDIPEGAKTTWFVKNQSIAMIDSESGQMTIMRKGATKYGLMIEYNGKTFVRWGKMQIK